MPRKSNATKIKKEFLRVALNIDEMVAIRFALESLPESDKTVDSLRRRFKDLIAQMR